LLLHPKTVLYLSSASCYIIPFPRLGDRMVDIAVWRNCIHVRAAILRGPDLLRLSDCVQR